MISTTTLRLCPRLCVCTENKDALSPSPAFSFFQSNNRNRTDFFIFFLAAKNRRVLNAVNEAMRRPVETLALLQQNDTGGEVPQPTDDIASNQGKEEAVDIDGGYTSSTSTGAVAARTRRRAGSVRKRYRALVEVIHPVSVIAHALVMRIFILFVHTHTQSGIAKDH